MRSRALLSVLSAFLFSAAAVAHADTFTLNFTSPTYTGTAVLTGNLDTSVPTLKDAYDITSATGSLYIGAVKHGITLATEIPAGLKATSQFTTDNSGLFWIDDVLYPENNAASNPFGGGGHGFVDWWGLLFQDTASSVIYNLYSDNGDSLVTIYPGTPGAGLAQAGTPEEQLNTKLFTENGHSITTNDILVASAPEPSSIALLATGLLGAAGIARRRMNVL